MPQTYSLVASGYAKQGETVPTASTREEGRAQIDALVRQYKENEEYFLSREFDEHSTRTSFIDRFFEALGWDVTYAGPDREVQFHPRHSTEAQLAGDVSWDEDLSQEELDQRAEHTLVPDYSFSVDGRLQFYVEAKRPSIPVTRADAVFQLKSYAWSRELAFSVLTNFARLRVFATTVRPDRDRPSVGLLPGFDLKYDEYVANWDTIWGLLSREAVSTGDAERKARAARQRGAIGVGEAFLSDLERWREELGNDLMRRQPDLEAFQLDEATQRILDRLVFIRVVEDRNIEPKVLLRKFARLTDSYRQLSAEFRRLDVVYNGQLFAEHWSEQLEVSDGLISRVIAGMYSVDGSPYRFDAFRADFLGKVYEHFLGKEFEVAGTTAKLIDKPEVQHAGGVYYTPRWVVEHMVSTVLDPLLDGRKPEYVARLRLLDPAAGSGSFLLGLLDHLIAWHEEYYTEHPDEHPDRHYRGADGRRKLTTDFKGAVAVNNIYGTDIDPQAVEVSQMSVYLRILEEETSATLASQLRLFDGPRLPSLSRNIRSGNSLIASLDVPAGETLTHEEHRDLNAFDWRDPVRGFGKIFDENGGFDVVIGNPPYTRVQVLRRFHALQTRLIEARYATARAGFDLSTIFIERGLELLRPSAGSRPSGSLCYITTRTFAETDAAAPLRKLLTDGRHVRSVVDFREGQVFENASAYTLILHVSPSQNRTWSLTRVASPATAEGLSHALGSGARTVGLTPLPASDASWDLSLPAETELLDRLARDFPTLGEVSGDAVFQAVVTGADHVFRADDLGPDLADPTLRQVRPKLLGPDEPPIFIETELLRPVMAGRSSITPFWAADIEEWLIVPYEYADRGERMSLIPPTKLERSHPHAHAWLRANEQRLRARASGTWTDENWYGYSRRQNLELWSSSKIMVPSMIDELCGLYDERGRFFVNVSTGGYGVLVDPTHGLSYEYVAAVLNSKLLSWVLHRFSRSWRGGWFEARKGSLVRLPIATANYEEQMRVVASAREVVQAMATARRPAATTQQKQVANIARARFDFEVERLYGLSSAQSAVVAGNLEDEY